MRTVLVLCLALLACSDSNDPESYQPAPGTYDMTLTACQSCDEFNTPGFALVFKEGVDATIVVVSVTEAQAVGEYTVLTTAGGSDLLGELAMTSVTFTPVASGPWFSSTGYASGAINVSLEDGGCRFGLNYPGVNTGSGTCELH